MTGEPRVRIARYAGTCGAPGCRHPQIWPGTRITAPRGRAWQHADCSKPARRAQADRDAEHAAAAARRRRR